MKCTFCMLYLAVLACMGSCSLSQFIPYYKNEKENGIKPEKVELKTEIQSSVESHEPQEKPPEVTRVISVKPDVRLTKALKRYCHLVDSKFENYGWGKSQCDEYNWNHVRNSHLGRPLIWMAWGEEVELKNKNVTLIMCGVHGDEITPIKFCFDLIKKMEDLVYDPASEFDLREKLVVVAPIVTPDSFFKRYPTRTNYRGVDVNRNFPTRDWNKDALRLWKHRYRSDKRRFPGKRAKSEQETVFQVNLIKRYKPDKIISVHSPLTILDYDGPGKKGEPGHKHLANQLLIQMSKDASGYRVTDYPFFPGSLGNWAGNERGIPTYTLELPTSDNRKHREYWKLFKKAIFSAINHDMRRPFNVADKDEENESNNKL